MRRRTTIDGSDAVTTALAGGRVPRHPDAAFGMLYITRLPEPIHQGDADDIEHQAQRVDALWSHRDLGFTLVTAQQRPQLQARAMPSRCGL